MLSAISACVTLLVARRSSARFAVDDVAGDIVGNAGDDVGVAEVWINNRPTNAARRTRDPSAPRSRTTCSEWRSATFRSRECARCTARGDRCRAAGLTCLDGSSRRFLLLDHENPFPMKRSRTLLAALLMAPLAAACFADPLAPELIIDPVHPVRLSAVSANGHALPASVPLSTTGSQGMCSRRRSS